MTKITLTPDVLGALTNPEEAEALIMTGENELSEMEVRSLISKESADKLFANDEDMDVDHPSGLGYIGDYSKENEMTENTTTTTTTEDKTMTNNANTTETTGYVTLSGYSFLPRTKSDEKYVGQEIPLNKASKALLMDLVEAQAVNIGEMQTQQEQQDTRTIERMQERAQTRTSTRQDDRLKGKVKLQALRDMGLEFSEAQERWLRTDPRRWQAIVVKPASKGYKVSFNFEADQPRSVLVKKLVDACKAAGRFHKVQATHVYVRM